MTDKVIGTGGDYTTINSWEADMPNLTATTQTWRGLCKNQDFNGGDGSGAAIVISGGNPSSSFYAELTTDTGASFADNANKLTNALKYNTANGAAIHTASSYTYLLTTSQAFTRINKLQFKSTSNRNLMRLQADSNILSQCILEGDVSYNNPLMISNNPIVVNCLVVNRSAAGNGIDCAYPTSGTVISSCTIVCPSDETLAKTGIFTNRAMKALNCAIFGHTTDAIHITYQSWVAGTDYIATDEPTVEGSGTHNVTSLTFSGQFEGVAAASMDYRAKASGSLDGAGVADSANTGDIDIIGQARSTSTPTIGCWEVAAAAPTSFLPIPPGMPPALLAR